MKGSPGETAASFPTQMGWRFRAYSRSTFPVKIGFTRGRLALNTSAARWPRTPKRKKIGAKSMDQGNPGHEAGGKKTPGKFLMTFKMPVTIRISPTPPK